LIDLNVTNFVELLTPIWERVLESSPIAANANFFDLGGDSSLALKLFAEISKACGKELPPVMIYQAPTIESLAAILEHPEEFRFPALTLLREGMEEPPIFITHGVGGNVMDFFQLVKHIQTSQPIYGMQSKGIDGAEEPFERIEDMAEYFLEAIRERQAHGPYYLVGYSLGGLVMLEAAQRLLAAGEKIGLLAMLETYPHRRYLPFTQHARLILQRAKSHAHVLIRLPLKQAVTYVLHPAERLVFVPRNNNAKKNGLPMDAWYTPALQRMRDRAYVGLKTYRPRFYPGSIKFVRAATVTEFPDDAKAVWKPLVREIEVVTAPGDHLEIINAHFEAVGAALSRYLSETSKYQERQVRANHPASK
jgi:acetoacetyl-CoA synthetase